jgi:Fe2+ transport system protein B
LEDVFERLKKNLKEALKESSDSAPVVTREPVKSNQKNNHSEDPDVQARKEEAAKRRMQAEEDSQRRKQIENSDHHEGVKQVLNVQEDILESLARSKGINVETLKIADRVGAKLAEQTEQMERIQAKLDELGDGLKRAQKEVSTVMRGIATDKVILAVICCLVMVCLLLLLIRIGYAIYQKVAGVTSLFPSPTGQKPVTSSSVASLFKYNGGNVLWN